MGHILVVSDETRERDSISIALERRGHAVAVRGRAEEVIELAAREHIDVVVSDDSLRTPGLDLLRGVKARSPQTSVVLVSSDGDIGRAVEAMRMGAHDYLRKPRSSEVLRAVEEALSADTPSSVEGHGEHGEIEPPGRIVGNSSSLRALLDLVKRVAETDSTVLITGETGTGKDLIGSAIHAASRRRDRIYSAVNSASFPETLLESELFGHRRGAFTGAASNKKGLFESADRGTVFLDEVAEMPLSMQAKLLRFLQTGEIRPVGSEATRCVDVRLVAATNKELEGEVSAGRFREDLYYRLAVIPIHVPPLRERAEDIPVFASHFLKGFAKRLHRPVPEIAPDALELLLRYSWPGNVRELENSIERAAALHHGDRIVASDLPQRLQDRGSVAPDQGLQSLRVLERSHILSTLERVGWNRRRAAEILEISTTTLWRRLKEFGIEGPGLERRA